MSDMVSSFGVLVVASCTACAELEVESVCVRVRGCDCSTDCNDPEGWPESAGRGLDLLNRSYSGFIGQFEGFKVVYNPCICETRLGLSSFTGCEPRFGPVDAWITI